MHVSIAGASRAGSLRAYLLGLATSVVALAPGAAAQSWTQVNVDGFGDADNVFAAVGPTYAGTLFAGTAHPSGGQVWRYDGSSWSPSATPGFGTACNAAAFAGAVYQGKLYVGTFNDCDGAEVHVFDGASWSRVDPGAPGPGGGGFGNPDNAEITAMCVFQGVLHVATYNDTTGTEVWAYDGSSWTSAGTGGFGETGNQEAYGLVVFDGALYANVNNDGAGCEVWRYDGATWTRVDPGAPGPGGGGFGRGSVQSGAHGMATCGGFLYVGTESASACEVWRYDGAAWTRVDAASGPGGFGDSGNFIVLGLACHQQRLYASTEHETQGGEVWAYDGALWSPLEPNGFGDADNTLALRLAEYGHRLYVGTLNEDTGAEVWRYGGIGQATGCPAVPNSTGATGRMYVTGNDLVAADDLTLTALGLPPQPNIGYFLMGTGSNTFVPPGSAGPICVAPGIKRYLPPVDNTAQLGGGFQRTTGTTGPVSGQITGGSTWSFQAWHRDSMAGSSNLSDSVSVTFQ